MAYELIAHDCRKGTCPAIHIDRERGTVAVQGYVTNPGAIDTPNGETAVEMPIEAFQRLMSEFAAKTQEANA